MGLSGKLALQPIYTMSGGQKSRVSLALITWTKPQVMLLDEPTNHLDLVSRCTRVRFSIKCVCVGRAHLTATRLPTSFQMGALLALAGFTGHSLCAHRGTP